MFPRVFASRNAREEETKPAVVGRPWVHGQGSANKPSPWVSRPYDGRIRDVGGACHARRRDRDGLVLQCFPGKHVIAGSDSLEDRRMQFERADRPTAPASAKMRRTSGDKARG
jgi:hypothetical protein